MLHAAMVHLCKHLQVVKKTQNKVYYTVRGHQGRYQSKAHMQLPISD